METFYAKEHLLRQIDDPCMEILKATMSIDRGPRTNRRNRLKMF